MLHNAVSMREREVLELALAVRSSEPRARAAGARASPYAYVVCDTAALIYERLSDA